MLLEKLDIYKQKQEPQPKIISYPKIKSKWTIGLNVKYKTMKILVKDIGESFLDPGLDKGFKT